MGSPRGLAISSRTPAARYSSATSAGSSASVTMASSSCARAIDSSDERPNLVASISPMLRSALARAALTTSASGRRAVVRPWSSVTPAAETNATAKLSSARNSTVQRPAIMRMCWSSSPGHDDDVDRVGLQLVGDRGRVGDERELVRRVLHQPARERQRGRGGVEEDRRAVLDVARGVRGDRGLGGAGLVGALRPRGRDRRRARRRRERARPAVHPLDQPLARELLEVAVDRDRRDRVVAREVGDGHAAVALDALEDLRAAECGRHGVQTRSTNSLRRDRHLERAELVDRLDEVVGVALQRLLALLRRRAHRVADHAGPRELAVVHREDEVLVAVELDVGRAVLLDERVRQPARHLRAVLGGVLHLHQRGSCAITCEVSSSDACQPGVSSGGFSSRPSRSPM